MDALVAKLKSLPPNTPITSSQLAELLEAVLSHSAQQTLAREPSYNELPDNHELTQIEVSQWLRKATSTLEKLRVKGTGPAYKPGKPVLYKVGDVKGWLASRRVSSTSEATVRGIHRFDSITDIFPIFTFENALPLGLESALDYQEENPEAKLKEVLLINENEVLKMSTHIDDTKGGPHIRSEGIGYLTVLVVVAFEAGIPNPYRKVFEIVQGLRDKGVPVESIETERGDKLPHLVVEVAETVIQMLSASVEAKTIEAETFEALEKLEAQGANLEAKNKAGLTPAETCRDNSNIKTWLLAKAEKKIFRDLLGSGETSETKKSSQGRL